MAGVELVEEDLSPEEGVTIDGEDGIAVLEAGGFRLWIGVSDGEGGVAGFATCVDGLWGGEANGMTERSEEEGSPCALVAMSQVVKVLHGAQVEVSEGESGHDCEESVLEASGFLQHKGLAAW